jgi:FkbM family methyltransferase
MNLWRRRRELAYRFANTGLLWSLSRLYRWHGLRGTFLVDREGISYQHETILLSFDFRAKAVAGNLDVTGNYEPRTIERLWSVMSEGDVFYDIGAHEGYYALMVHSRFPHARIVAIEPLANMLRRNIALNKATGIEVLAVALGDAEGSIAMTTHKRSSNYVSPAARHRVPMETLDRLVARGLPVPNILKMDVEGYEPIVLRGAARTVDRHRPMILLEINESLFRYQDTPDSVMNFFVNHSYRVFAQASDRLLEARAGSQLPISLEDNFWAIPSERADLLQWANANVKHST